MLAVNYRYLIVVLLAIALLGCSGRSETFVVREQAYRANNRGVAKLEQFEYTSAAEAFRESLAIDDTLNIARFNLALAFFYDQDLENATTAAVDASSRLPTSLPPLYLLGLIARAENRPSEAIELFLSVLESDPRDVGTNINLGQMFLETQQYDQAIERLRLAYAEEPFNVTAVYNLGLALARNGERSEGREILERAIELRSTGYAITYGSGYLEEGRHARAVSSTGAEPTVLNARNSDAMFVQEAITSATQSNANGVSPFGRRFSADELSGDGLEILAASLGGGVTPIDFDSDGDIDLFVTSSEGQQLLRNDDAEMWSDVTEQAGLSSPAAGGVPITAITADFDNNYAPDLFVLRYGESSLYRNDGAGSFIDVTETAGLPDYPFLPSAAAFVDIDHDGDVDLLIGGLADLVATQRVSEDAVFPEDFAPAPLQLLRNNQDGTFSDITIEAQLDSLGHVMAVVPTDFNNRRDVDLLVVDFVGVPRLFSNLRDGTFRDAADTVGLTRGNLPEKTNAVAVADLNKDDFPDIFFAGEALGVVAMSDGRGHFTFIPGPPVTAVTVAQFLDYDNDGLLDLLTRSPDGFRLFRFLERAWIDVSTTAMLPEVSTAIPLVSARSTVLGDLDRSGTTDLVTTTDGQFLLLRNTGDTQNQVLRIELSGLASNRTGIGTKVQMRAGSLRSRVETSAASPAVGPADLLFGVGQREGADVIRVLWPSGILQAETAGVERVGDAVADAQQYLPSIFPVREIDRKPSSCPLLYAWNGHRFEFVTDFLGGGEMGLWHGPSHYNSPDPLEYVRIRGDQLRPHDGVVELRITNELEEALFVDEVELLSFMHPQDIEIFPNEGMTYPPKPHEIHVVRDTRVPLQVIDDGGNDVTERISYLDRNYVDSFPLTPFRGYAEKHTLTIDLGTVESSATLLLTGWTDYAFSSDNVAAYQAGLGLQQPEFEIRDIHGRWRSTSVEVGVPVGRPQTIAINLSDQLHPGEHEVRLSTNFRIYWDQILIGETASSEPVLMTRLDTLSAELRARGFSSEVRPNGSEPPIYDYTHVTEISPWKTMVGRYTREGDVKPLLTAVDDMFVITMDGDEIALKFDGSSLDPLPKGWRRTYLMRAYGFSKEMDINSASPDVVEPLPFHSMSGYPYRKDEHYPDTPEHRRYRETYNTRVIVRSVPLIETSH